ncbi:MAG: hypothetical protein ABSE63_00370 [Thermoguttaceae bacterium]|jgi:hypothetical protein
MTIHFKTILLALSALVVFGLLAGNIAAQSSGPAALAAKQKIKNQVLAALSDGQITPDERRDILSHAKNILNANEYVGLVETINRLSPPDQSVPEDIGYTPLVDKQLMANFPAPDLSRLNKSKLGEALSNQSFVKEIRPKQNFVVKETTPKQTHIVKEIITKRTIVEDAPPNQSVAKATTPKQPIGKTAKPKAAAKTADVVVIPPPPPIQEDDNQPNPSTVGRSQKSAKADNPPPPMPPSVERSQTRNAAPDKPVQQKISTSTIKRPSSGDQVDIKQPVGLLNIAERSAITHFYADYSVPVLSTPAAALLTDRNSNAIKASFDQPLEPESGQSIIRQ